MAVDANAGTPTGRTAGYGAMRLLELPRDTTVKGPGQVQNDIESSNIGRRGHPELTIPDPDRTQQGSKITLGNLLTLPVGGGLLYVEPIYVSAKTGTPTRSPARSLVAFGNQRLGPTPSAAPWTASSAAARGGRR